MRWSPDAVDPRPTSWDSRCWGWDGGFHERARVEPGGWRCRWCFQLLYPPPDRPCP